MTKYNFQTNIITKSFSENLNGVDKIYNEDKISPIEIDVEQLQLLDSARKVILMERPLNVRGIVMPHETKGRKPAPNPVAFDSLSKYIRTVVRAKKFNLLSPDSDRGHIFALELGGPNSKYNIMPQWNGFQEHGDWRKLERKIKATASSLLKNNNTLFLEVNIEYLNLGMRDLNDKLSKVFDFNNLQSFNEDKVKKCLQVFGLPIGYEFNSFPCNINISKPHSYSLSLSYIKYLYNVAKEIYSNQKPVKFATKVNTIQKKLAQDWPIRKLINKDLINFDEKLLYNVESCCEHGKFVIPIISELDIA